MVCCTPCVHTQNNHKTDEVAQEWQIVQSCEFELISLYVSVKAILDRVTLAFLCPTCQQRSQRLCIYLPTTKAAFNVCEHSENAMIFLDNPVSPGGLRSASTTTLLTASHIVSMVLAYSQP